MRWTQIYLLQTRCIPTGRSFAYYNAANARCYCANTGPNISQLTSSVVPVALSSSTPLCAAASYHVSAGIGWYPDYLLLIRGIGPNSRSTFRTTVMRFAIDHNGRHYTAYVPTNDQRLSDRLYKLVFIRPSHPWLSIDVYLRQRGSCRRGRNRNMPSGQYGGVP
jgi:hypothetical protein